MPLLDAVRAFSHEATTYSQRLGRAPPFIVILWLITLWWGERSVFKRSVAACDWHNWESWPLEANPHHVLFVADPQLVDPHTYPGRPWPLSTLTVLYTDLYMRRTYRHLLDRMQPHSTLFLGDLFDGGREWATSDYESPEDRYKKYGGDFWLREYNRFMDMFVGSWYRQAWHGSLAGEGRRIVASLPGNHDLGFGGGINEHVRSRFEAHFGPSNRIDILGNHTFVSLDTVSLSAMNQVDLATGSFGAGDGTAMQTKHMDIWKPVENFLINANTLRDKAIDHRFQHLRSLANPAANTPQTPMFKPQVFPIEKSGLLKSVKEKEVAVSSSNFPTIVLSHVPFYRDQDVSCGPQRERGSAIPIWAGYQYQNVLTPSVSKDIVGHLDAEQIAMIYSGDDHDYCEIEHSEFTGQIKEITVKSISWAMGVRKPGVQLTSLWNPVDINNVAQGEAAASITPRGTVQNHLCLLPDQLAIFIRYGQLLAITAIALLVRAVLYKPQRTPHDPPSLSSNKDKSEPLLPVSRRRTPSPSDIDGNNVISISHPTARARSSGPGKLTGYGNIPTTSRSTSPNPHAPTDDWGMPLSTNGNVAYARTHEHSTGVLNLRVSQLTNIERALHSLVTPSPTKAGELIRSLNLVAGPVLLFYFWLLWNG